MTRISVRVQPRASCNEITGYGDDGVLRIRVTAPPADGQANAAVERTLADALRIGRKSVQIALGMSSRVKVVEVDGLSEAEIRERIEAL
jgi:hypothetical protein